MRSSFDKDVYDLNGRKKVVVFGTRYFDQPVLMNEKLDNYLFLLNDPIIVSGGSKTWDPGDGKWVGADYYAEQYATRRMLLLQIYHADWKKHKKAAGPIRNREMAEVADFGVAFWDGESRGTKNMIEEMRKLGKPVKIVRYDLKKRRRK